MGRGRRGGNEGNKIKERKHHEEQKRKEKKSWSQREYITLKGEINGEIGKRREERVQQ